MKLVKNFVFAVLLASVLAVSVTAGEVEGPGAKPSPSPSGATVHATADEKTGDPNASIITAETSDYLFFEALAALLSMY
mgnify:CR=1 FL=1